jgi:uncharacterized protein YabN with tetrapyrrole methylase and pyrophosphatase domain
MSWSITELNVIRWSEARGIIPNSTSLAQYKKAQEEMHELQTAICDRDRAGIIDGVGDVLVCLINVCALEDVSMTQCLEAAYQEIKDRRGTLGKDGIFRKEANG